MKVYVESVLQCPAERVWDEVQRPALLLEVIRPLFRFVPADGPQFPERWSEGATVRCKGYLFGVIPLGTHMTIPGYGEAVAADTGGAIIGSTIDLWFPTVAQANAWGRRVVTIVLH